MNEPYEYDCPRTQLGSGIRTEQHKRTVGQRVKSKITGEVGTIYAYDIGGDYYVDTGRADQSLHQADDDDLADAD